MRDFDAWLAEQAGEPTVAFRLGGREFHVRNPLPVMAGLRVVRAANDSGVTAETWVDFLRTVVVRADAEHVEAAIASSGMGAAELEELCLWITAEVAGRPTTPRSERSESRSANGRQSKPRSRSKASTRRPSLSVAS